MTTQLSKKSIATNNFASRRILNTDVIDSRGKKIGAISEIFIDSTKMTVEGIQLMNGSYIGKNYIAALSDKGAIVLKPVECE